jgi:hypothetical protein
VTLVKFVRDTGDADRLKVVLNDRGWEGREGKDNWVLNSASEVCKRPSSNSQSLSLASSPDAECDLHINVLPALHFVGVPWHVPQAVSGIASFHLATHDEGKSSCPPPVAVHFSAARQYVFTVTVHL